MARVLYGLVNAAISWRACNNSLTCHLELIIYPIILIAMHSHPKIYANTMNRVNTLPKLMEFQFYQAPPLQNKNIYLSNVN